MNKVLIVDDSDTNRAILAEILRWEYEIIEAESSPGFITRAYDFGAADYVSRPFDSSVVQRRVKNTITLYAKQKRLVDISQAERKIS